MPTECSAGLFESTPEEERAVVASFDGGTHTLDVGALVLGNAKQLLPVSTKSLCVTLPLGWENGAGSCR